MAREKLSTSDLIRDRLRRLPEFMSARRAVVLRRWAPAIMACVSALVAIIAWRASNSQHELGELTRRVQELERASQQQTAVLQHALGKVIPIELPDSLKNQIESLESRLRSKDQWPSSAGDAERMRQDLAVLVKGIPPWAEDEILPRLNCVRWAVEVLWTIRSQETRPDPKLDDWENAEQTYQLLVESKPEGALNEVASELQNKLDGATRQVAVKRRETVVSQAKDALEDKGDVSAAWTNLESVGDDEEIKVLREKLRIKLLDTTTDERVKVLKATLKQSKAFSNERLKQAGVSRAYDAAVSLLLDLELEKDVPATILYPVRSVVNACEDELKRISNRQHEDVAKSMRDYQRWALEQIQQFSASDGWHYDATLKWIDKELKAFKAPEKENLDWELFREFPSTKELIHEKLEIPMADVYGVRLTASKQKQIYEAAWATVGWKNKIDQEIAYRTTRDGMVKYLLPINVTLLDPPVAQLYNKAFNLGWNKLEGRDDQLYVAQQSAIVQKKGISDMTPGVPK